MKLIVVHIDGQDVQVPAGTTILEAAQSIDLSIPTLCSFPGIKPSGFCRICVVEVDGYDTLLPACITKVKDGMVVKTQTPKTIVSRRMSIEMLIAQHPLHCLTCYRNGKCELQQLAAQYGIEQSRFFRKEATQDQGTPALRPIDDKSPAIVHDPKMCILCGLCIETCRTVQGVDVIDFAGRGHERTVECAFGQSLSDVECTACGQCIQVCPTHAYYEKTDLTLVRQALRDPALHVVGILSPMVGVSIGEEFEQEAGTPLAPQLVAALKMAGFQRVFDVGVGVDLLLLEEAYELLTRLKDEKRLPMISSSSPAVVKYMEHFHPDKLNLLSTSKTPPQSLATLIKTYYAKQAGLSPEQIFTVSLTPCTAEKFERTRPEMAIEGRPFIDACLTTREIATLLKQMTGDLFLSIAPQPYDPPFDQSSGAADIWGLAGGMLEGMLRTYYELATKKKLTTIEFEQLREPKGFQEVALKIGKDTLSAAILHGTGNIAQLMDNLRSGSKQYHYVEIKGCPYGCARGGGLPLPCKGESMLARVRALYALDSEKSLRKAHDNPVVKQIYDHLLKKPATPAAQKLVHTKFVQRQRYL